VIVCFLVMGYKEKTGHYPLRKATPKTAENIRSDSSSQGSGVLVQGTVKDKTVEGGATNVREIRETPA
jgi:hypothetical protein